MKICKNCNRQFTEHESSIKLLHTFNLPEPEICPECRFKIRLSYMNLNILYKRKCDLCGKDIFSMYDKDAVFPVYCPECWWSDKWDPLSYGMDYKPQKNIFIQFKELSNKVPHISLQIDWQYTENSEYINGTGPVKDSYLAFNSTDIDNVLYARSVSSSNNSVNCANSDNIENSYHIYNSTKIHSSSFVDNSENCIDVHYSSNLRNCQNCFLCSHLSDKKYHIFNKEYTKEKYEEIVSFLKDSSFRKHETIMQEFLKFKSRFPQRSIDSKQSENVSGNSIYNSKNVYNSFEIIDAENVSNSQFLELGPIYNVADYTYFGDNAGNVYNTLNSGTNISNVFFTMHSFSQVLEVMYSEFIYNSSYILFSSGVKNKKFVILNKEYDESSFYKMKEQIIQDMIKNPFFDSRGVKFTFGDFFPQELSPFYYTETLGQEYAPLNEDEALKLGFRYKDINKDLPQYDISYDELPDKTDAESANIIGKTIKCKNADKNISTCRKAFKITAREFDFLFKNNLPLPRLCVDCRYKELIKERPGMTLKQKTCDCTGQKSKTQRYTNKFEHGHASSCANTFITAKNDDKNDIYCPNCYDSEFR